MKLLAAMVIITSSWMCSAATKSGTVDVCLDANGNSAVLDGARAVASRVFQTAGVRTEWHNYNRPCESGRGFVITIDNGVPADQHRGALAYALPYEGTHLVLLYDRASRTVPAAVLPTLIGYVLAHEIGHLLQGVSRHSDDGVMKAHWGFRDYADMQLGRLRFAAEDVELMRAGLDRRVRAASVAPPSVSSAFGGLFVRAIPTPFASESRLMPAGEALELP